MPLCFTLSILVLAGHASNAENQFHYSQLYVTVVGLGLNHTDMDCFEHYLQEKEIFSINSIVFIITSRSPGHRKGFIGF